MNTPETEAIMNHVLKGLNENCNGLQEKKEID